MKNMEIIEILKNLEAQKQIDRLARKYKNKKVVLYGAGKFFETLKNNYDISKLNVIAVADKKFEQITEPVFDSACGCNVIAPASIYTLKPDIVLLCVQNDYYVEKDICENIFKQTKHKFKYRTLFKQTIAQKIFQEWENF